MKYFLIAGEPSGDMHAADLMVELLRIDKQADFAFFGGEKMTKVGGKLLKHYREMAFMGIGPVLSNLGKIRQNFRDCEKALIDFHPDVLILIDYPGFNLRMARFAKKHHIKTVYYISPKIWAWKTKRIKKIKAYIDRMHTIFPFETEFYAQFNHPVKYVGNPVYDQVKKYRAKFTLKEFCELNHLSQKPIISLFPGSRSDEIKNLLPVIEKIAADFPEFQCVICGAPNQPPSFYEGLMKTNIPIVFEASYEVLSHSHAAVVASGTATLETALFRVPQVVVYKMGMGWLLEKLRKFILKTDFFSLVNLVAEKEVVRELFQSQVTPENIKAELNKILTSKPNQTEMIAEYKQIEDSLRSNGAALETARSISKFLKETTR